MGRPEDNKFIKKRVKYNPYYIAAAAGLITLLFFMFSAFEITPKFEPNNWKRKGPVLDRGDNFIWLGMELAPLNKSIRKEFDIPAKIKGIFVISPGSAAAQAQGVKTGDIIRAVNRNKVRNSRSFVKVANRAKYYDGILLDVYRDDSNLYITIPFSYEHGPWFGPYKGRWQLGSPLLKRIGPYGELIN